MDRDTQLLWLDRTFKGHIEAVRGGMSNERLLIMDNLDAQARRSCRAAYTCARVRARACAAHAHAAHPDW